jgi:glucose-1-phosphate thymidylyltransferase
VVSGLYFFDKNVNRIAKRLKPSLRGELEITDLINEYARQGKLKTQFLNRGFAWLDTGTSESLIDASSFVKTIEDRQGLKIGCIEEVAYRMGYINKKQFSFLADSIPNSYGEYLRNILKHE